MVISIDAVLINRCVICNLRPDLIWCETFTARRSLINGVGGLSITFSCLINGYKSVYIFIIVHFVVFFSAFLCVTNFVKKKQALLANKVMLDLQK